MVPVRSPLLPELHAAFATPEAHLELGASTTGPRAPPTSATSLLCVASMRNRRRPLPSIIAAGVRRAPEAAPLSSAHGRRPPWVADTHAHSGLPPPLHPVELPPPW
ncbi:hypothetical protein E2562_027357 [Oryza meyeriana var. granulata]|uniref:Uncharacterized protein n=1 Tax=Oryza meyeriana var. granulata TaxID=110450 RepID=A0A6G1C9D0_9ORYZ|nr:hypothetical protein E2562_027357 [Oryza meyeriana var. granulata]